MVPTRDLTRRTMLIALGAGALAACGSTGSRQDSGPVDFARPVAALPPIPPGQGRIVIMREDWAGARGPAAELLFNERPAGTIADGKLLARDVAPGFYRLGVAQGVLEQLGVDEVTVEIRPGAAAYVRMVYFIGEGQNTELAPGNARRTGPQLNRASGTIRTRNFRFAELPGPPR